ncbi:aspartyl-phosphate phosphatase Spo0E family protein [Clostridium lacusfryxellense]|uniref:aspartyl-phosphate phosphatase Spo0E family protein n=1 Tax=Clostridium lacusfryxellense TaxID=205328 RepID=UPI001FE56EF2|nr:aspartyl-phosphate phosphatase Spo0E family protein [Clostridium lacusfryxellense]
MDIICIIITIVSFEERVEIMGIQIELLRTKLEELVEATEDLLDNEVVSLSQELDKLIFQYYLYKV